MNRVFILCSLVVLGSMFLISSARMFQYDSTKFSKHHEYSPKTKSAKSANKLEHDSELPVHVTDDGYTIVRIPKTAERHSLIDSLMEMFRNGTDVDHQALLVIAPQTAPLAGGDDTTNENKPQTESDVAVSVHDRATLPANETTSVNATLPRPNNTDDDQQVAESARIETATWLRDNVLHLNEGTDGSRKELLVFTKDDANGNIDPSGLQFVDITGLNCDLRPHDNGNCSDCKATDALATSKHKSVESDTPAIPNTTTPSYLAVSDTETTSDLKDTDTKSSSESIDLDNTTLSILEDSDDAAPSNTKHLKDTDTKSSSESTVLDNTTPSTPEDSDDATPSNPYDSDGVTPSNSKNSGTETTSDLKVSDAENASDLNIIHNTTPTTASEQVFDATTSDNIEVSTNAETTTYPKIINLSTTIPDLPLPDLENTHQNRDLGDPSAAHYDLQSSYTIFSPPSADKESTSTSTKLKDDELSDSFDNLVHDLSIISSSIDVPNNFDATNRILNEGEPLIDVCRESQKELIDIFSLGLEQLSSLFTAMYKRMSSEPTQTTQ